MKNQYFADTRDLFKYDLVLELLEKSQNPHFTFVPMLTQNDPNYKGGRTNYDNTRFRPKQLGLRRFLENCVTTNNRNVAMLERFFGNTSLTKRLDLTIYSKKKYFASRKREGYFLDIPRRLLTHSIILVDPDIGLEVPSMRGREENYLTYDEARTLHNRMDEKSTLLIFQFIPRVRRIPYLLKLANQLCTRVTQGLPVHYITDNQIAFFVLAKTSESIDTLAGHLASYADNTGLLFGRN